MIRIGNASGFYGDRYSAVREMLTGGQIDVLTGDYLAELTMLILGRDRMKDPEQGYARTFLRQMRENLELALEKGVKIVANAGGLNPVGLSKAIASLGTGAKLSFVEGDDLTARFPDHVTANAYLGAWGIAECLRAGADVVITGRVTDASLVVGPAAAHFGWQRNDFDALAGAVAAGHILECGTQATGGNYAFFDEIDWSRPLGFPIAEVAADGSCVITKHPGTGGAVSVGTVTAQLLYEIDSPRYLGPDVTTRFDTIQISQQGPDRVSVSGVRGEAPPATTKVCLNRLGGFRNHVEFVVTGLDLSAKQDLLMRQLADVKGAEVTWVRHGDVVRCVVKDPDPQVAGRAFSSKAIELALGSYPGFQVTAPPGDAQPYGVYTPAYVPADEVPHTAVLPDGARVLIPPTPASLSAPALATMPADRSDLGGLLSPGQQESSKISDEARSGAVEAGRGRGSASREGAGATVRAALGRVAGARSGDKGGDANVGVWVRSDEAYQWLAAALTADKLRELLPELTEVDRYLLPNLRAVNFVCRGLLGEGVSSSTRFDPQAKSLGEQLRACEIDIPEGLL